MRKSTEKSSDEGKAYGYAIRLLTSREYGAAELFKKLCEKYTEETAQRAVLLCSEQGFQSDERFAEMLCRHAALKPSGPNAIVFEAERRGLDPDLLDPYLEEMDFDALAAEFLQRRFSEKLEALDDDDPAARWKLKQKMMAALFRRGFDADTCRRAVELFS